MVDKDSTNTSIKSGLNLASSQIGINIIANPKHFQNGVLQIKCIAKLIIIFEYDTTEYLITGSFKNKTKYNGLFILIWEN